MKLNIRFLRTLLHKKQWITNQELHHVLYGPPRYFIIFLLASFLVMQFVYYSLDIQNFHKYFGLRGDFIGQDDFVTFLYPAPSRAPSENVIVTIGADLRYGPNLMGTITDNNFTKPLSGIAHVFRDSDINFLSLDGPITSSDAKRTCTPHEKELKRCCDASCFWKNDFSVLKAFRELGVNGVGIENEHILDYGREGLEDTLYYLRDARIPFAGMGYRILYKVKECGIAILQYNWAYQEEEVYEKMKDMMIYDLKVVKADVHIVIMHGGNQKGGNKTIFQEEFAKLAIDNGAGLVVGTHSRIRQKSEMYKDRKIYYGLGSIMDENFIGKTANTFSLLRFEVAQCKNIVRLKEIKGKKNLKTLEVSVK